MPVTVFVSSASVAVPMSCGASPVLKDEDPDQVDEEAEDGDQEKTFVFNLYKKRGRRD
jgi:hypothetical protein